MLNLIESKKEGQDTINFPITKYSFRGHNSGFPSIVKAASIALEQLAQKKELVQSINQASQILTAPITELRSYN